MMCARRSVRRRREAAAARPRRLDSPRHSRSLEILLKSSSPHLSRRNFSLACASALLGACASPTPKIGEQATAQNPLGPVTPPVPVSPAVPATPAAPVAPSVAATPGKPLRIGLALGGGAARGFAHVGVIKALEARGLHVDLVCGTSAGSVVGALYASGMSGIAINKLALTMDQASISDWATPFRTRGFLQGVALQNYINTTLENRPIEKMTRPLGVVATDLRSGQPILFQRGNTGIAVRASCSVPSIFEPVTIGGHEYVDGGLVSPVPASFARKMGADFVIAVDISAHPETALTQSSFDVLLQTFTIMGQTIKTYELEKYADFVIRPNLAAMGGSDFGQRNTAILAGEEAVAKVFAELQRKLAASRAAAA
jgi:NTE family protein